MFALLRPQASARSVNQPEPAALGLPYAESSALTSPDTLDLFVVICPAHLAQQCCNLAIPIAAVLPETPLVVTTARELAWRRAMLPERRTGATLGDVQLRCTGRPSGLAPWRMRPT
jgi:hypothetical protein